MADKKTTKKSSQKNKPKAKQQRVQKKRQKNLVFSLDIGTRTVVGIVGEERDGSFHILDSEIVPHSKRAMIDGQIEEIDEVARIVGIAKSQLENRLNVKLSNVSIAAAGRALKTQRVKVEIDVPTDEPISAEISRAFEIEAVSKAQSEIDFDGEKTHQAVAFYCVGHSVVGFELDGYPMKTVVGHKGKKVSIELIAAFLPSVVVESLYSVMEKNKLTVSSLTLEPIAAMNVIIPPEVRLINIALVDIGAGTSDIAISQNGSIVAYAMATIAGDEITEEIIKHYLVDFSQAEKMKVSQGDVIDYTDILGIPHSVGREEFTKSIHSAVDNLADTVCKNIIEANGQSPAAVFLVGGGSLAADLPTLVAQKLDISSERVAVGGHNFIKNLVIGDGQLNGPEFVTPIGIGVTATMNKGYDFSVITLNEKKIRVLNTKNLTVFDILLMSGYKTRQIIGATGRSISFTKNGERVILKGSISTPATITLNDEPCRVDSPVKQGDRVNIIPAVSGVSAEVSILDMIGDCSSQRCTYNGKEYEVGIFAYANGNRVFGEYQIKNNDEITSDEVLTISDLIQKNNLIEQNKISNYQFKVSKAIVSANYVIKDGDVIQSILKSVNSPKVEQPTQIAKATEAVEIIEQSPVEKQLEKNSPQTKSPPKEERQAKSDTITIILNGKDVELSKKSDGTPNLFLEVLSFVDVDMMNKTGTLIMKINGKNAMYMSEIFHGDVVEIRFE